MDYFKERIDFGQLKKYKVYDNENEEIGTVNDFVFNPEYKVTKFLLGGSFLEEFREKIGLKPDDDPIHNVSDISEINNDKKIIKLNLNMNSLGNKLQENAFSEGDVLFTDFCKKSIISSDGKKIGKIVDTLFDNNGKLAFIIGDSKFVEFLEKIGVLADYDLLLPIQYIEEITEENIKINQTHEQLSLLLNNEKLTNEMIANHKSANINKLERYNRYWY